MSQLRYNDLNMTIGVLPIEFEQSIDDNGNMVGTQAPGYKFFFEQGLRANVTYVTTPITGDEVGECFANGTCTGHLSQLWLKNQDLELVRQSLNVVKFVTTPPVIFSPVGISWTTKIISMPQESSNLIKNGDVIDSFNIQTLLAMIIGFLLISRLLLKFKSIYYKLGTKCPKKIIWTVLRSFIYQFDFNFEQGSFRIIAISTLLGLFVSKAYYDGTFTTDLTIKEKMITIDSLSDLLNSNRWPAFFLGDTALKVFETSRNGLEREVATITKSRYKRNMPSIVELNMISMNKLIAHIRKREAVLIGSKPVEVYIRLMDCYMQIKYGEPEDMQFYHSKESYHDEINSFIYNPNISTELRTRLDKRITRLFEMHFFYKVGVIDVFEVTARGMDVDWNWKNSKCVEPDWNDDEQNTVIPLRLVNVKKLMKLVICKFALAFVFTIAECIFFYYHPLRRRVIRMETAVRVVTKHNDAKLTFEVVRQLRVRREGHNTILRSFVGDR